MRNKRMVPFLLMGLLLVLIGCAAQTPWRQAVRVEDPFASENEQQFSGLVVTFFALPQGESTLLRFPNGRTLLIDAGSEEDGPTLLRLLEDRHVTRLDYAMITSDQPAQAGGYPYLSQHVQIDTLLLPELTEATMRRVVPFQPGQKLVWLSEGDEIAFDRRLVMTVLNPSENLFLSPQDNSLVVLFQHDRLRFLFTGAINEQAEERLLARHGDRLSAEVLKVADQGRNQASSQPFLSKVDPQVAIIETGKTHDEMKSGEEEIIERLGESWAETYITSQHGTITILSNGKDYRVIKERKK